MKEHKTDTVFLHNLRVSGTHGVYDHERRVEQEFMIDIEAGIDTGKAAQSDKLGDTVDYVHFKKIAEEIIGAKSYYLIEKIADAIAQRILEDVRVERVSVTIKKPAALSNGLPGVTLFRSR